jgi:hypothetical protein
MKTLKGFAAQGTLSGFDDFFLIVTPVLTSFEPGAEIIERLRRIQLG